ncbi:MAG: PTS transporter subunit EIIB [Brevinema sp.]
MDISHHIINLVGGASNIADLDNCKTRVRIIVHNPDLIAKEEASVLENLSASPVINGKNVHVIVGTKSTEYKEIIAKAIKNHSNLSGIEGLIVELCGGLNNIAELDNCTTRVRIIVHDPKLISKDAASKIEKLNFASVINGKNIHVIVGKTAEDITSSLRHAIQG